MEDQSEVIMQAGIKMPLLLFQYFPEFIQEKKKKKKRMGGKTQQYKGKNIIGQLSNQAYFNLEGLC